MSGAFHPDRLSAIYQYIEQHPGCGYSQIARGLGMTEGAVRNNVTTMEYHGLLLGEENSKLYAVKRDAPPRNELYGRILSTEPG